MADRKTYAPTARVTSSDAPDKGVPSGGGKASKAKDAAAPRPRGMPAGIADASKTGVFPIDAKALAKPKRPDPRQGPTPHPSDEIRLAHPTEGSS